MEDAYRDRERVFAGVMADRADWEAATRAQRHLAVAADAELRRRHPEQRFTPLRLAEPHPATDAHRAELALTAGQVIPEAGQWIKDLSAQRRTFAEKLADRQTLMIPSDDPVTAASARRSHPGPAHRRVRSCSLPSRRSVPRPGSWSASWTATPTWKPGIDGSPVHPGRGEVTVMAAIGITGMRLTGAVQMTWVQDHLFRRTHAVPPSSVPMAVDC
jgi:hypothetical protein